MAVPWFIWADDKGRFMITFLEHLLHKSHWKQKGGVKLCIPAAFTQSLLELKTCVENGCSCFSWIHCGMHGALWEWGKLFSLGLENTGFQIWIPYLVLHSEPFVLAMGNVKQLRSNRHDQNYDFFCPGTMSATCYMNLSNKKTEVSALKDCSSAISSSSDPRFQH